MSFPLKRVLHQVWLGPNPMPSDFSRWMDGWAEKHPDWDHCFWTDETAEGFDLYRELAPKCDGWATRCDLLRLILMAEIGGLYVDVDFECHAAFDDLLDGEEFVLGAFPEEWNTEETPWVCEAGNGLIYAAEGSRQARAAIDTLRQSIFPSQIVAFMVGPNWLLNIARSTGGLTLLDADVHAPNPPWLPVPDPLPEGNRAVHHWEGSWLTDASREHLKLSERKTPFANSQPQKPELAEA